MAVLQCICWSCLVHQSFVVRLDIIPVYSDPHIGCVGSCGCPLERSLHAQHRREDQKMYIKLAYNLETYTVKWKYMTFDSLFCAQLYICRKLYT